MSRPKVRLSREQRIEVMLTMCIQNQALIMSALGNGLNSDADIESLIHRAEFLRSKGFTIPTGGTNESN